MRFGRNRLLTSLFSVSGNSFGNAPLRWSFPFYTKRDEGRPYGQRSPAQGLPRIPPWFSTSKQKLPPRGATDLPSRISSCHGRRNERWSGWRSCENALAAALEWFSWILKTSPWKWEMRQQKTLLQQKTCCYDMQGQEVSATLRLVFPMQKLFSGRNLSVSSLLDSISIAGTILSRWWWGWMVGRLGEEGSIQGCIWCRLWRNFWVVDSHVPCLFNL